MAPHMSPADRWIVVGAGSAGCVVARRLIDHGHHVTLIEAGPALNPGAVPPGVDGNDSFAAISPDRVVSGLSAVRVAGRSPVPYLRGRGVGGSSVVNAMLALRGDESFLDAAVRLPAGVDAPTPLIPAEVADDDELGLIDRALLSATPDARKVPLTRRNGRRVTSAEAYLWPVLTSRRFHLLVDAPVDRVVFHDRRATGVRLVDGTEVSGDHIVMCAGAIHSPAILLRSGVEVDGIGHGLQDHPAAAVLLELNEDAAASRRSPRGLSAAVAVERDPIQVLAMNHLGTVDVYAMLMVAHMRPRSASGRVRLRSDDPADEPIVEFDLLSDPRDIADLRHGVRLLLDLLDHDAFTSIVDRAFIDDVGTTTSALDSDDAIASWLLARSADYVHASGTCAIGRVTNNDGAVHGHRDLFVCDASLFPTIPNTNTHLPTTLLAERLVAAWVGGVSV